MQIVIPMAGRGTRTEAYQIPKPLIPINSQTMIEWSVNSLDVDGQYIFITRRYPEAKYNEELESILRKLRPDCLIIDIDFVTKGPLSSALLAASHLDGGDQLIVTNCDRYNFDWGPDEFLQDIKDRELDGSVVTYASLTPKNSYVKLDPNTDLAVQFTEKQIISTYSLNGIHHWTKANDFIHSGIKTIHRNVTYNDEFYISLSYNILIEEGKRIGIYDIPPEHHWATGTTEDIEKFKSFLQHENIQIA